MKVTEVARAVNRSADRVRYWCQHGYIPSKRVKDPSNGKWRYDLELADAQKFIASDRKRSAQRQRDSAWVTAAEEEYGPAEIAAAGDSDCLHHYKIESVNGGKSWGECSKCGARREFYNTADVNVPLFNA